MQVVLTVLLTSLSPQDCTHHETVENKLSSNNFTSSFPTTGWNYIFHKIWKNIINIPTRNYGNVTFVPLDNICEIVKFAFSWWYFFYHECKKGQGVFQKNFAPERVHYSIRNIRCVKTSSLLKSFVSILDFLALFSVHGWPP